MGIGALNFRLSMTGARVLELAGDQCHEKADQLADRLSTVFGGAASFTRPMKCADIRISGLDDSATAETIAAAVARVGGCSVDQLKVRELRTGPRGMGSVIVKCPVTTAKVLTDTGKVPIGWSSAGVQALGQRPLRCFKCLGVGHTKPMCPSAANREELCFRCSREGHRASDCTAAPHCAVCAEAGKPAKHTMGGRKCNPPPTKLKAARTTRTPPGVNSQTRRDVEMRSTETMDQERSPAPC